MRNPLGVELKHLAAFANRHPIALFCALAFAFSWAYWLTLVSQGLRVAPGSATTHLPGLAGPFLAALCLTALRDGPRGVRRFVLNCVGIPFPRPALLLLALSPLFMGAVLFTALGIARGQSPALEEFNSYPGTPAHWHLAGTAILALVLNGIGEEGGWRGYLLPRLAIGRSKLRATLLLSAIWMTWHAPLFVLNASMSALLGPTLIGWAVGLTAGSVVLAWLYFYSKSILVVAVWHTSFNFLVATAPGQGLVAAIASTAVIGLGFAVALVWWRTRARNDA